MELGLGIDENGVDKKSSTIGTDEDGNHRPGLRAHLVSLSVLQETEVFA